MSKGLKMTQAMKEGENQASPIDQLSKEDNGRIYCEYCGVPLEYNSGHTRKASGTIVPPYLKLAKNKEHQDGCSYTVSGAVKVLVSEANSVENAKVILENSKVDQYIFRLNYLEETQIELAKIIEKIDKGELNSDNVEYEKTSNKLASYFKSAIGVAKLKALIEEASDEKISDYIQIYYKDKVISWDEFFFDDENYNAAHQQKNIDHPIALKVTVKQSNGNSVQCYSQPLLKDIYVPWINPEEEINNFNIENNHSYIILSKVTFSSKPSGDYTYHNLNMKLSNINQVVQVV